VYWDELRNREKDRLVAEIVLGHTVLVRTKLLDTGTDPETGYKWFETDTEYLLVLSDMHTVLLPAYTVDWNDAWAIFCTMVYMYNTDMGADIFKKFYRHLQGTEYQSPALNNPTTLYNWLTTWLPDTICKSAVLALVGTEQGTIPRPRET
jgi:hypothetical protein